MFTVKQPYALLKPYGSKIPTEGAALKKCLKDKKCAGFSRYGNAKYKLNKSAKEDKTKAGRMCFVKEKGMAVVAIGMLWTRRPDSKLSQYVTATKYKKDSAAMTACASNEKCTGVTKVGASNYRLNSDTVVQASKGKVAFVKGSTVTTAESKYWTVVSGYKFNAEGTKKYTTLADAMTACMSVYDKGGCYGVSHHGDKSYYLGTATRISPHSGYKLYIVGGDEVKVTKATVSYDGYSYNMVKPFTLGGKLSKKKYKSAKAAIVACNKNKKCNGVIRERAKVFYIVSGSTPTPASGFVAFSKSGKSVISAKTIWTTKSGVELKGSYSDTKHTSRAAALKACAAATGCKGVTKYSVGNFKLRSSITTVTKSGATSWVQGDSVMESNDFYWISKTNYKIDAKLSNVGFSDKAKALSDCAHKNAKCTGVSKIGPEYFVMTGSGLTKSDGSKSYLLGDRVEITSYIMWAHKAWQVKAPYKLSKPIGDKTYKTLYDAAEACVKNKKCVGFTRIAAQEFTINSKVCHISL